MYSQESVIKKLRTLFAGDASGHDVDHSIRVFRMACRIADEEPCDRDVVVLASLLHDADDVKLFSTENYANARCIMTEEGIPESLQERVIEAISTVSFKGTDTCTPDTIEGMIVQDADRLDAIGAIGIARAFAFGGSRGRSMYDLNESPGTNLSEAEYRARNGTTINHFYEKLFLLKDLMNTKTAKRIAEWRDRFMHVFVDEFLDEWNGDKKYLAQMRLQRLDEDFSVCKVDAYSSAPLESTYCFMGKTDEEKSLVCLTRDVPEHTIAREDGWKGLRVLETLDFTLVGILAEISSILAAAKIPILAISTYNTDYVFVKEAQYRTALSVLEKSGYMIVD